MAFFAFRQQHNSVQGLMQANKETISKQMVKWAQGLHSEDLVLVEGTIQESPVPIKSCTISNVEIKILKVLSILRIQSCWQ